MPLTGQANQTAQKPTPPPPPRPEDATAKQRFQMSPVLVAQHRAMIGSEVFEVSIDVALLELQAILEGMSVDNPNLAASLHFRLAGANQFIRILKKLSSQARPVTPVPTHNLKHDA